MTRPSSTMRPPGRGRVSGISHSLPMADPGDWSQDGQVPKGVGVRTSHVYTGGRGGTVMVLVGPEVRRVARLGLRRRVRQTRGAARRREARPSRLVPDPVFVISSVRSGSTLLRVLLKQPPADPRARTEMHLRTLAVDLTKPYTSKAMAQLDLDQGEFESSCGTASSTGNSCAAASGSMRRGQDTRQRGLLGAAGGGLAEGPVHLPAAPPRVDGEQPDQQPTRPRSWRDRTGGAHVRRGG